MKTLFRALIIVVGLAASASASGFFGGVTTQSSPTASGQWQFTNQLVVGDTTAKSTFTPTALTLDDGLTLTANGPLNADGNLTTTGDDVDISTHAAFGGQVVPYMRTAAQLSALAPIAVGALIGCSDCTAAFICQSSGTLAGAWVEIGTKTTACDD